MSETAVTQKVAAILAADAVAYSRLMAGDELATIAALDEARAVFIEHTQANQGRVVDTAGDSVLAVFETTVGAVRAGLAIQERLAEIVAPRPDGAVRVGVVSDGDPWSVRWVAEAEASLVPPPDAHGPSPHRLSATSEMATAVELVLDAARDLGPRP